MITYLSVHKFHCGDLSITATKTELHEKFNKNNALIIARSTNSIKM